MPARLPVANGRFAAPGMRDSTDYAVTGLRSRPSRIAQMLVHGFARAALDRIVCALHTAYFPALLVDDVEVIESVSFGGAIRDTEQLGGTVVTLDGLTLG